jgi:hypothetical protein
MNDEKSHFISKHHFDQTTSDNFDKTIIVSSETKDQKPDSHR